MVRRTILGIAFACLGLAVPVLHGAQGAETFGIGASLSSVNSVNHGFHLDRFDTVDWNAWVQYQLESDVELRGTFGSMKVRGYNGGQSVTLGDGSAATLPELRDRIQYGLVTVAYEFHERAWTSGLFAGLGAYGIDPESADPAFETFRDKKETAWGLHFGLDADVRVWRGISVLGRLTLHIPQTKPQRRILTAGAGLLYRF
ncbi:MAG: hypothetical protein ACRD16_12365 [Thermoanaerobaculia bacterium]